MFKKPARRVVLIAWSAIALLVGVALVVVFALLWGNAAQSPAAGPAQIPDKGRTPFTVGDCVTAREMSHADKTDRDVASCADAHTYEVYSEFTLDGEKYPSKAAVRSEAEAQCVSAFEAFVGVPFEESSLDIVWDGPTKNSWNKDDDRTVQCLVFDPAGEVDGTLKGASR